MPEVRLAWSKNDSQPITIDVNMTATATYLVGANETASSTSSALYQAETKATSTMTASTTSSTTTTTPTTTTTTTTTTPPQRRDKEDKQDERESRTFDQDDQAASFGGRVLRNKGNTTAQDVARDRQKAQVQNCDGLGSTGNKCASFVVSKVPVLDSNNTERVVNEFVFMPEDSGPLELDQSDFANVTSQTLGIAKQNVSPQNNETSSANLPAEHRTLDGIDLMAGLQPVGNSSVFANSSLMLVNDNGEIELDYTNMDSSDNESGSDAPDLQDRSVPAGGLSLATVTPNDHASTARAITTTTTTTTTTTPRPSTATITSTTTPAPTRVPSTRLVVSSSSATSTTSTTQKPTIKQTLPRMEDSITIKELRNERVGQQQRLSTPISRLTATTTTTTSAPRFSGTIRQMQTPRAPTDTRTKALPEQSALNLVFREQRIKPVQQSTATSTTTARPTQRLIKLDNSRTASARRAKSMATGQQHRQVFSEPMGGNWDQRRRQRERKPQTSSDNIYSPMNNGADEEEASILTRYSMTSQLSRLSALNRLASPSSGVSSNGKALTSVPQTFASTSRQQPQSRYQARVTQLAPAPTPVRIKTTTTTTTTTTTGRPSVQPTVAATININKEPATSDNVEVADLISKIMNEEDAAAERATNSDRMMMTLIASSLAGSGSQNGIGTSHRNVPVLTTTLSPPTSTSSLASTTTVGTSLKVEATTLGDVRQEGQSTLAKNKPSQLTTTTPSNNEQLVDLVIKEQLERDSSASDLTTNNQNGPKLSGGNKVQPQSQPTPQTTTVASTTIYRSQKDTDNKQAKQTKPNRPLVVKNKQMINASTNPNDYDSGKWRPDYYENDQEGDRLSSAASPQLARNGPISAAAAQRDSLPGRPGIDYPVHGQVPKTSFDCRNYEQSGFYADVESDCQAYHSCHRGRGGRHTFLCPNGTLFSQELLTCDWWYNVECSKSKVFMLNGGGQSGDLFLDGDQNGDQNDELGQPIGSTS